MTRATWSDLQPQDTCESSVEDLVNTRDPCDSSVLDLARCLDVSEDEPNVVQSRLEMI